MNRREGKKEASSVRNGSVSQSNHKLRKAESQVAGIREFHDAGKEVLLARGDKAALEEISRKYLIAPERLSKCGQFAQQYTAAEVNAFCAQRKPDGMPLQVGYLDSLLSLPWETEADRCTRSALEREAASKGWSAPDLAAEIKMRSPKKRPQSTSGKNRGRPRKSRRIDRATREARALLHDLTCQIQRSTGIDEQYFADLLELQSQAQSFAAMAIQAV